MIKNLVFDFGDVFINLDKLKPYDEFAKLGFTEFTSEMLAHNEQFEIGKITSAQFAQFYINKSSKTITAKQVYKAWNSMLVDFPLHRLQFIQELASVKNFRLFLLSNTNDCHIKWIKDNIPFYLDFKLCFEQFYLSQEIRLRKPNANTFQFVCSENNIEPKETLFIDDTKENIVTAKDLKFKTWHINPKTEDVVDLFKINANLF